MKTKELFLCLFFFGCYISSKAQLKKDSLNIFTFEEVEKLQTENPKPILAFIYTDWCKFCNLMKKTTFRNSNIVKVLNRDFYVVFLNSETKNEITFLDKTFVYKPNGTNSGTHQLATELGTIDGKISYPTTIILNEKYEIDLKLNIFLNTKDFEEIVNVYLKLDKF